MNKTILGGTARIAAFSMFLAATVVPGQAVGAEDEAGNFLGLDLKGSLGEGRHKPLRAAGDQPDFERDALQHDRGAAVLFL